MRLFFSPAYMHISMLFRHQDLEHQYSLRCWEALLMRWLHHPFLHNMHISMQYHHHYFVHQDLNCQSQSMPMPLFLIRLYMHKSMRCLLPCFAHWDLNYHFQSKEELFLAFSFYTPKLRACFQIHLFRLDRNRFSLCILIYLFHLYFRHNLDFHKSIFFFLKNPAIPTLFHFLPVNAINYVNDKFEIIMILSYYIYNINKKCLTVYIYVFTQ